MNGDYWVLLSLFVVIILVVVLCVVWSRQLGKAYILPNNTDLSPTEAYVPASLGSRCVDYSDYSKGLYMQNPNNPDQWIPRPCADGLVCVKSFRGESIGLCRVGLGNPCSNLYQCTPEAVSCYGATSTSPGVCTDGATGGIFQPCFRFQQNMICSQGLGCAGGICLYKDGNFCRQASECLSGVCDEGVCKVLIPPGETCSAKTYNADDNVCQINYGCDGVFCQPLEAGQPRKTGTVGSVCYRGPSLIDDLGVSIATPKCNAGLVCSGQIESGRPGTGWCLPPTSGLFDVCSSTVGCIAPLICRSGTCQLPQEPNNCDVTTSGLCSSGFICQNGSCRGKENLPCISSTDCLTGSCSTWKLSVLNPHVGVAGFWMPAITLPAQPISTVCLTVYQNASINYALYYSGSGDIFYLIDVKTYVIRPITINSPFATTLIVNVRFTPQGSIAILANINNTYDKIFLCGLPISYGPTSTYVTLSGNTTVYADFDAIDDFDIDDTSLLQTRFLILSSGIVYVTQVPRSNLESVTTFTHTYTINNTIARFYAGTLLSEFYYMEGNYIKNGSGTIILTLPDTITRFISNYDISNNPGQIFALANNLAYRYTTAGLTPLPGKFNPLYASLAVGQDESLYIISKVC